MRINANSYCRCTESLVVSRHRFTALLILALCFCGAPFFPLASSFAQADDAGGGDTPAHPPIDHATSGESDSQPTLLTTLGEKIKSVQSGETPVSDLAADLVTGAEADTTSAAELHYLTATLPNMGEKLAPALLSRLPVYLANVSVDKARGFLTLATAVYAEKGPVYAEVKRDVELARKSDELVTAGKRDELLKLAQSLTKDTEKTIIATRLAKLIGQQPASAETPFDALRKLAEFAKFTKDPQVPESVAKVLLEIDQKLRDGTLDYEKWCLDEAPVRTLIRAAEQVKPEVKATMASIYDQRIRKMVDSEKPESLTDAYLQMLEARPDPNQANDELRMFAVLNAKSDDARQFAMGRLEELRYTNKIGMLGLLRVFMKGYYGRGGPIFMISSIIIVLLSVAFMLIRPFFVAGVSDAISRAEDKRSDGRPDPTHAKPSSPGGKMPGGHAGAYGSPNPQPQKKSLFGKEKQVSGYARGPVEDDEYTKLLALIGLDDTASEGQIKKAYRAKVKNLHPDTKPGEATEDQEFIELKEVYDRILQIRGSWFGGKR